MIKIEALKAAGIAEKKLAQKDVVIQKKLLAEFREDAEVAKALDYLERFNDPIPDSHPIFKHVNAIKKKNLDKEVVRETVKNKVKKNPVKKEEEEEFLKQEEEAKQKKIQESQAVVNGLLQKLEEENDKVFEYVDRNMKTFSGEYSKMSQILKLKRFLISVKNGVKIMRIK